jgi:hypothetical protein
MSPFRPPIDDASFAFYYDSATFGFGARISWETRGVATATPYRFPVFLGLPAALGVAGSCQVLLDN